MKVYISVPMVANRDLSVANSLARAVAESGHELTSPWVLGELEKHDRASVDVFRRDSEAVMASDAIVADVSSPSVGVGMELMAAHLAGKRVVIAFRRGSVVSRMLLHMEPKEVVEFAGEAELGRDLRRLLETGWKPPAPSAARKP